MSHGAIESYTRDPAIFTYTYFSRYGLDQFEIDSQECQVHW